MKPKLPIYLDHNATTPVDERVFKVMAPYFTQMYGNAASGSHSYGWDARRAVEHARAQVAGLINADPSEIVWTSGSTESNNLAIKGIAEANASIGKHIITQTTEHKAVLDPCKHLQKHGFEITWLQPDSLGRVTAEQVRQAIRPDTILVSIMWANNEIGTIQPIREIGAVCRDFNVLFHTDATQAIGKVLVDVREDYVDLLSLSGHKFYGPKGCGCLYVRNRLPRIDIAPILDGGGHENGYRSGTLNVPGIVGVGAACELAQIEWAGEARRLEALRNRLQRGIMSQLGGVTVNGSEQYRLPHVTNLSFEDVDGEALREAFDDIAVSSGSACTSALRQASYVLRAIGVPDDLAYASIRFSLGQSNTEQEIDYAIEKVVSVVKRLRKEKAPPPAHWTPENVPVAAGDEDTPCP
jgi:cysteine desulfurase